MRSFHQLLVKFRMAIRRGSAATQLDDELRFHLDRQIAENAAAGMPPDEARAAALRAFGNPALLRDQTRATWSWNRLESLLQDFRSALRSIRRRPAFALAVIATMALGIAAAAAMFTVVDRVLLRPVPYSDPNNLVILNETDGAGSFGVPWRDIEEWQAQAHSFTAIAFAAPMNGRNYLEGRDAAQQVDAERVTTNLFDVLGAHPSLGRGFIPAPPSFAAGNNSGSVILSDTAWREVFAADPGVLGRSVKINNQTFAVTGVMPRGFAYPAGIQNSPQIWVALQLDDSDKDRSFQSSLYTGIARLRNGVSLASATAEMTLIQKRLGQQYPNEVLRHDHTGARVRRYADSLVDADIRKALIALLSASATLWLIAALNVAGLLLARNMTQQREMATRVAIGAGRLRIMQQMLVEGLVLNGAATAIGLALAIASLRLLAHELSQMLPLPVPSLPDPLILLALPALTLLSTLASTAWPALLAIRMPVEPALRQGGLQAGTSRRQHRLRALLVTCGLLLRSIYTLRHVPLGYRTDHIIVANLSIPAFRFEHKDMTRDLYLPLLSRVENLHGVQSAGLISSVPLGKTFHVEVGIYINGRKVAAFMKAATPGMQPVLGFRMAAGRYFNAGDNATSPPVAVVNQAFAKRWAPDRHNPASLIGTRLVNFRKDVPTQIIGILDDERQSRVSSSASPEVEFDISQFTPDSTYYNVLEEIAMDLAVRTDRPASQVIPELRAILKQTSPELENVTITTMDQVVEDSYGSQRLAAHLLEIFGASALLLSVAGLYGLLAYLVAQRTHEIGLRIALGASRQSLLVMVLRQAAAMLLPGVAAGVCLALAAGRLVQSFLFGVSAHDAFTLGAAAAVLLTMGLLAAWIPAQRAAHVNPMEALRVQ